MANPKRASMREGPLAALFRKTEDLEKDAVEQPATDAATPHGGGGRRPQALSNQRPRRLHLPARPSPRLP